MRALWTGLWTVVVSLALASTALAQGSLTGTVRDGSGAVLPGVTVEASSPVLIEKVRTVVTDGTGQWRIVDLRPGTYTVVFSLDGFRTVRREGIQLTGAATLTIPAELSIGALQETITVLAETPVVDVQNVRQERVLQADVIQSLPATRSYGALLIATPGIDVVGNVSAPTTPQMTFFTARGGATNEGRVQVDGMNVAAAFNGGGVSTLIYNTNDVDEISVMVAGGLGEAETGGPHMNIIPRSGGNTFSGQSFLNLAGDWSRAENLDDELRSFGIERGPALLKSWDVSGSYGGPIKRDRLWFYGTVRNFGNSALRETAVAPNLFAGDPTSWAYAPDTSIEETRDVQGREIYSGRLTAQLAANRFSFSQEYQDRCDGTTRTTQGDGCRQPGANWSGLGTVGIFGSSSAEAHAGYFPLPYHVTQATWTMPATNRLLLEAGFSRLAYVPGFGQLPSDGIFDLIPVTEQRAIDGHPANFTYRAVNSWNKWHANPNNFRASLAYVTGSHNFKTGYQGAYQVDNRTTFINPTQLAYRFSNGTPNRFTVNLPDWQQANRTVQHSLYAQDSWTLDRLTLQGALRYDHAYSWHPAEGNGTTQTSRFNPEPITFERTVSVRGYDDVSPRVGAAYDLFGTGKTALKANFGRYLDAATNDGNYTVNSPANRVERTMNRSWVDTNNNLVVDCDILDFSRQTAVDTCGSPTGQDLNFGDFRTGLTQVNQDILGGFGVRSHDWQFGLAVQQEVLPRVSVEVSYNRRWWGNFFVEDNLLVGPDDYEAFTFLAPTDSRLPNGGGYPITVQMVTAEAAARGASQYVTFESDYGAERTEYWHGVDFNVNARMRNGLVFQGGTSTGRKIRDRCATLANIDPDGVIKDLRDCRTVDPFRTSLRGLASYTVPMVDVLVSASFRSLPAPELTANFLLPNTEIQAITGRMPPGGSRFGNQNINLLRDSEMYADDRLTQVDMRFAKIVRFAGMRADLGLDLYNLFNSNTALTYDGSYDRVPAPGLGPGGQWLRPVSIVQPRFVRVNLTFDF